MELELPDGEKRIPSNVFCSGPYSCFTVDNRTNNDILEDLMNEEIFLEEMLVIYVNLIKPFRKKGSALNIYETLCRSFTEIMSVTALNVSSLADYYNQVDEAYNVTLVANADEFITIYKYYLNAICGIISYGGFAQIADCVEVTRTLTNFLSSANQTTQKQRPNKNLEKHTIVEALQHPLLRLSR